MNRIHKFGTIAILLGTICVYYLFEEKQGEIAQAIYFFIGGYSQIYIVGKIMKDYKIYDARVIYLSR